MSKSSARLLAFGLLAILGCGEKLPESNTLATAAHGGQVFRFLDKSGSVEIGSDPADPSTPGVSKKDSHVVFAYFTQADGVTALASPPADVKIVPGSLPPIDLKSQDKGGQVGRFASPPGPRLEDFRGVLEATIEGRKVEVPFILR